MRARASAFVSTCMEVAVYAVGGTVLAVSLYAALGALTGLAAFSVRDRRP